MWGGDIRQVAVKSKACLETFDKAAGAAEELKTDSRFLCGSRCEGDTPPS